MCQIMSNMFRSRLHLLTQLNKVFIFNKHLRCYNARPPSPLLLLLRCREASLGGQPRPCRLAPERNGCREGGWGAGATTSTVERRIDGTAPRKAVSMEMPRPPLPGAPRRRCRIDGAAHAEGRADGDAEAAAAEPSRALELEAAHGSAARSTPARAVAGDAVGDAGELRHGREQLVVARGSLEWVRSAPALDRRGSSVGVTGWERGEWVGEEVGENDNWVPRVGSWDEGEI
jgi:hypothetical protein